MSPIFLILGTPASGKSTVAKALLQRFSQGVHLPVDNLRHLVVSGLSDLGPNPDPETWRQVAVAREVVCQMAETYTKHGFAVAIDDFWQGDNPEALYPFAVPVQRVVLFPSLESTINRLYARNPDEGDFKQVLEGAIRLIYPDIERHAKTGWIVVDSSHLNVQETVDHILQEAKIQPIQYR